MTKPDSHDQHTQQDTGQQDSRQEGNCPEDSKAAQSATPAGESKAGDSTSASAGESSGTGVASHAETVSEIRKRVFGRFGRERRDMPAMGQQRDEMLQLARKTIKDREERLKWVYSEMDRLYPPLVGPSEGKTHIGQLGVTMSPTPVQKPPENAHSGDSGQIQGLSSIPDAWPGLASNAELSSEIGWVQANRLHVVEERPGKATLVHLDRAHSPAPSYAALGWLETSIRSYAKFVDVAAKVSGSADDETAVMKRERVAIEEVEALLDEMRDEAAG